MLGTIPVPVFVEDGVCKMNHHVALRSRPHGRTDKRRLMIEEYLIPTPCPFQIQTNNLFQFNFEFDLTGTKGISRTAGTTRREPTRRATTDDETFFWPDKEVPDEETSRRVGSTRREGTRREGTLQGREINWLSTTEEGARMLVFYTIMFPRV
jgi:hypothetical protein